MTENNVRKPDLRRTQKIQWLVSSAQRNLFEVHINPFITNILKN